MRIGRVHGDDGLRDLCVAYHVNEETFPLSWSPFWQPFSHQTYDALIGAARLLCHSGVVSKATGAISFLSALRNVVRERRDAR